MIQAPSIQHSIKPNSGVDVEKKPQNSQSRTQANWVGSFLKGLLDYLLVVPGLFFITPLFTLIALMVKLESPGPIFYRHRVVGRNGREFNAYKFRTMYINAEDRLASQPHLQVGLKTNYSLKHDPRLTRTGYLLHKFGLDDLPQLFNILKRDMSLVGPRIVTYSELAKYGPYRDCLLSVLPGLIGLWQVQTGSDLNFEDRIGMDMAYIQNWSVLSDIQIIFRTVPALVKGDSVH